MWACPDCMKAMGDAEVRKESKKLTNSRPIPLEAPWTIETPPREEEEDEEKALRVSDRNRGECDAIKKYWVGGKCNIIVTSKERVKLLSCLQSVIDGHETLKRGCLGTKKTKQQTWLEQN